MCQKDDVHVPLAEAAQRLGMSWQRAWRLVLTGELEGIRQQGRWLVGEASIRRQLAALTQSEKSAG